MSDSITSLFIDQIPLIDVRAPIEFAKGSFPNATNLPILDDKEREQIGICYKTEGALAASRLGHELVSGDIRSKRIQLWLEHVQKHPDARLFCYRGGQRSAIASEWLNSCGVAIEKIEGGYKRLRQSLLAVYENLPDLVLVSGQTGCGKTTFLTTFQNMIDLEGLANHRGSAFGAHLTPQPSQIDFENRLAIRILQLAHHAELLLEDEGRLIGRINLPPVLQVHMQNSPIMVIEAPIEVRVDNIYREYIVEQWQTYLAQSATDPADQFQEYLLNAVDSIRKRLGNVKHQEVRALMLTAGKSQRASGDLEGHRAWISELLTHYYDPMYKYQLSKKTNRIAIKGSHKDLTEWYRGRINE